MNQFVKWIQVRVLKFLMVNSRFKKESAISARGDSSF